MSSIHDVLHLCDKYDLKVLQETWLFKHELSILNNLHVQFEAFGCSAINDSNGIVRGRPYFHVGGRYCHQTSSLFTIITKHIHHR